jgi:hypothetical protein
VSSPPPPYVSSSLSPVECRPAPREGRRLQSISLRTLELPPCRTVPWRHRRRRQASDQLPPASHRLRLFSRCRFASYLTTSLLSHPVCSFGLWFLTDEHFVTHWMKDSWLCPTDLQKFWPRTRHAIQIRPLSRTSDMMWVLLEGRESVDFLEQSWYILILAKKRGTDFCTSIFV